MTIVAATDSPWTYAGGLRPAGPGPCNTISELAALCEEES